MLKNDSFCPVWNEIHYKVTLLTVIKLEALAPFGAQFPFRDEHLGIVTPADSAGRAGARHGNRLSPGLAASSPVAAVYDRRLGWGRAVGAVGFVGGGEGQRPEIYQPQEMGCTKPGAPKVRIIEPN